MLAKKEHPKVKSRLHPRSKHRERYDFKQLIEVSPELAPFVQLNKYKDESIDFSDPAAVKMLNKALLKFHYQIEHWDIPKDYLCPPIPGRADYIHHVADLLASKYNDRIPKGKKVKCLDIGVGANCIYPLIGHKEYGWSFVGTDIDPTALASANKIVASDPELESAIEFRAQAEPKNIFKGIIQEGEYFDLSISNPPFNSSLEEALASNRRKSNNLSHKRSSGPILNFGGQGQELWCEGGEKRFVGDMIEQSKDFATSCFWFTTLVSKHSNLKKIYAALKAANVEEVKTIPMGQGSKSSRIVAWTFLTHKQRQAWIGARWHI